MSIRLALIGAAGGAVLVAAAVTAWNWHGSARYDAGYAQALADAESQRLQLQEAMQYEIDQATAKSYAATQARNAAQSDLSAVRGDLDRLRDDYKRQAKAAAASARTDGASPDWIGGFGVCYAEYDRLARDAAKWADQVNGWQDYARGIGAVNSR